ncbi:ribosomal-protein-alanine acetyltransferase [Lactococcus hodotermopsidis]|uniref:[Ribosomal protein bS18]-alanine N-acetyltransferase n=1 Tax=Pseudolactococcus hodotermopsidis TaxID=2709157 RepID=A0A6A0BDV0_9LACT|nr:ribosomal protein S18-alanine N-acetyltransferase [Lactococcus hodotermopsidis]GFH42007.1 ribosomal-protein-alanine acetyltransferase [Lactococcus hodotermopsidis]
MITIRQANFLTDCFRDVAVDIQVILADVYTTAPWTFEQTFADMLKEETTYFLAFSDEKMVGFLALSQIMDETEITNIAVKQAYQGRGIASLLLSQLAEFDGKIFLEVRKSNLSAQKLYKKFGFQVYHIRKNYYQNPPENAVLMKRSSQPNA